MKFWYSLGMFQEDKNLKVFEDGPGLDEVGAIYDKIFGMRRP